MLVFKSEAFRVQTAPFDKIRTEFRRSRRRLLIPDLLEAKKQRREITSSGRMHAVNREFVYIDFDDERFPAGGHLWSPEGDFDEK